MFWRVSCRKVIPKDISTTDQVVDSIAVGAVDMLVMPILGVVTAAILERVVIGEELIRDTVHLTASTILSTNQAVSEDNRRLIDNSVAMVDTRTVMLEDTKQDTADAMMKG